MESDKLDEYIVSYFEPTRDYFKDVVGYRDYLVSSCFAPKTITFRMTYVFHYLEWNGITFTPLENSMIRAKMPRNVAVRDEDIFDLSKIRSLLAHSDIFLRALVLVLVSSGMRVGEALLFTKEQIRGNEIHMQAGQMKAGKPQIYFISSEALEALGEWQKVRDEAIRQAQNKTVRCLGMPLSRSDAVFCCRYNTARVKFQNTLKKAGLYEKDTATNWGRLTFHGLRKFTDSTMKAHISVNLANALIGHYEAGDTSYRRYNLQELRAAYAKVEPFLLVNAPADYAENKNEVKEALSSHDKLIVSLIEKNLEIEKRLDIYQRLVNLLDD